MVGAVYCPLSPRDPTHRLETLLRETASRVTLVHQLTQDKLAGNVITYDIDSLVNTNSISDDVDFSPLSNVTATVTGESIAYVIFTSGSTGTPKAVSVHKLLSH